MKPRKLAAVLFTDIVGSTGRLAELGDAGWSQLLNRHQRMVRAQIEHFGGREVTTTGDGFLVVFDEPGPAIRCAAAIRDAARSLDIEVRSGVHAGEIERTDDDDVGGIAVHLAARVMGAAGPGEILVTGTVRDLAQGGGFSFEERGSRQLTGVPGRWPLFAVLGEGARPAGSSSPAWRRHRLGWAIGGSAIALVIVTASLLLRGSRSSVSEGIEEDRSSAAIDDSASVREIAILPLENLSPDPEDAYLAGALTEEITSALSKVPGLQVVSRTSAAKVAGSNLSAGEIADELGVRYLLEGSARRAGDQVVIVVQLIDALTDEHVWTQRYERTMEDVLSLQVEIAREIADELRSSFTDSERERILAGSTSDPLAYDLFLQAVEGGARSDPSGIEERIRLLEEAVGRDPRYGQAWLALGVAYWVASFHRGPAWADSSRQAFDRATQHMNEPSQLATVRAYRALFTGGDPSSAMDALREASAANPGDPILVFQLAQLEVAGGDLVAGVRWGLRARAMDPLNSDRWAHLGLIYVVLALDSRAEETLRRATELDREHMRAWLYLYFLRLVQERYAEAIAMQDTMTTLGINPYGSILEASARLWGGDLDRATELYRAAQAERPWDQAFDRLYWGPELAHVLLLSGDSVGAADVLRRTETFALNLPPTHWDTNLLLLELAAVRGETALAGERLRRYAEVGGRDARFIRLTPSNARALADPEFQQALTTLEGLAERDRRRVERLIAAAGD